MGWNTIYHSDGELTLINASDTLLSFNSKSKGKVDMAALLAKLEEANVPLSYTKGVHEIQFTLMPGLHGDYFDGKIRLSCMNQSLPIIAQTFVHELAHHVDEVEDISSSDDLMKEKKRKAKHIDDSYASKNIAEYIAVGFEVFYFGGEEERKKLRECNPKLYRTISRLHRKYSRLDSRT